MTNGRIRALPQSAAFLPLQWPNDQGGHDHSTPEWRVCVEAAWTPRSSSPGRDWTGAVPSCASGLGRRWAGLSVLGGLAIGCLGRCPQAGMRSRRWRCRLRRGTATARRVRFR